MCKWGVFIAFKDIEIEGNGVLNNRTVSLRANREK